MIDGSGLHYIILQVDKLKILSESLANSTSKAEKRMLDHRYCVLGLAFFFFFFCSFAQFPILEFVCLYMHGFITCMCMHLWIIMDALLAW
jgi:hypothetical protein